MTVLYRFYDASDVLLYVGITQQWEIRMASHRRGAPWWDLAERLTFAVYPDRQAAQDAERAAIKGESPVYNIHRPGWRAPRGPHSHPRCSVCDAKLSEHHEACAKHPAKTNRKAR